MQLINYKNKIYLEFVSNSKIIKKSLGLEYNPKNLKYAETTLMPIFDKLKNQNLKLFSNKIKTKITCKENYKLSEIFDLCFDNLKITAKISTINSAKFAFSKVLNILGDLELKFCNEDKFQKMIYNLKEQNLSPRTIRLILSYLNYAFLNAQKRKIIKENPIKNLKKPKISRTHKKIFSQNEIEKILKFAKNELKIFLYIAFYTGARCGEILALKKDDVNFINKTIKISKNQTRFELTTPKNGNERVVYMPKKLSNFLQNIFENFKKDKIFCVDYFQIYRDFKMLLLSLKIQISGGLHLTRHTYATILLKNSISPLFIANNLGHANLTELNCTYSQILYDNVDIKRVEKIF